MGTPHHFFFSYKAFSVTLTGLVLSALAVLNGCSGGPGSSNLISNPSPTSMPKTVVQVNMGDSPADWMLAFSMNITSMSLTGSNGTAMVVSSSMPMEMMHLMGTMQPLAMINAPQGTYSGASITMGSATVLYMDPTTKSPAQATIPGPITGTVTFSSPVTVGSTPMAMGFDLDLASSIAMGSGGILTMNPVFHVSSATQGSGNPADFSDGGIQQMMGSVSGVSGSSFTMSSMQAAQSFTFMTNSSTVFTGTSMSSMANGMLVVVDATLQSDGSLLASRVQSMMASGGVMGGGIVTAVTGQPPTSLTMVMQNGAGRGMMSSYFAAQSTVTLSGSTTWQIGQDGFATSGLPFSPVFDAGHIYAGQRIMPVSATAMMSGGMGGGMMGGSGSTWGSITASQIVLEPQGMSGTAGVAISSGSTGSFILTLPSDCAFTTLTGATSVMVFQQPQTVVAGTSPLAGGSKIHAFGLMFFDNGQWKMVAMRVAQS